MDRLDKLDTTPLVEQGVIFTVAPPQFIYTKVGEAKIEMLAEATKDARARAEQIATQGGRSHRAVARRGPGHFSNHAAAQQRDTSWRGRERHDLAPKNHHRRRDRDIFVEMNFVEERSLKFVAEACGAEIRRGSAETDGQKCLHRFAAGEAGRFVLCHQGRKI